MAKTIQVRDVPDEVHDLLRVRAARADPSLSEYLRREIGLLARRPTREEFLAAVAARPEVAVSADDIVASVHAERGDG